MDIFHEPISIEEFRYAISIWSSVITGRLPVPEMLTIPENANDLVTIEFAVNSEKVIRIFKDLNSSSLPALIAVAKEFSYDDKKKASILLHCFIFEKIITCPLLFPYTQNRSFYDSPYLDMIKDIPIKINEEPEINNLNMEYILEKIKSI